jgi:hypothetical protein
VLLWLGAAAAAVILLAALLEIVLTASQPNARASARLLVAREKPHVLFDAAPRPTEKEEYESYRQTQLALVKSRVVLNAALRRPGVAQLKMIRQHPLDPVEWLEGQLQVDYSAGPDILTVSLSGNDGDELKAIVEAVTQAYLDEIVDKDRKRRNDQAEELRKIQKKYQDLVEAKRKTLHEFLNAANRNDDLELERRKAETQLQTFLAQLAQVQSELLALAAAASKEAQGIVPEATLDTEVDKDPQVQAIVKSITQLTSELCQLKLGTPADKYDRLSAPTREKLDELQKQLKARRDAVRPAMEERLKGIYRAQKAQQQERVRTLEKLREMLDKNVDDLGLKVLRAQAPKRGMDMAESMRDDLTQMEDILRRVSAQVEIYNVELDAESRIRPLGDKAEAIVTHKGDGGRGMVAWCRALLKRLGL